MPRRRRREANQLSLSITRIPVQRAERARVGAWLWSRGVSKPEIWIPEADTSEVTEI